MFAKKNITIFYDDSNIRNVWPILVCITIVNAIDRNEFALITRLKKIESKIAREAASKTQNTSKAQNTSNTQYTSYTQNTSKTQILL